MGKRKASQEMNHSMQSDAQELPIVLARRGRGEAHINKSAFSLWHPTTVFESFWKFATERQAIFYRRLATRSSRWTTDHTLATFKFTNVYRASDRVSQFLIRRVIYA